MRDTMSDDKNIDAHWDDETIGFDMHPTQVSGVGAVRTTWGTDVSGNPVKFIEVWDGSLDAGDPIGTAGIRPTESNNVTVLYHATWNLTFTDQSVSLHAVAIAPPSPWVED